MGIVDKIDKNIEEIQSIINYIGALAADNYDTYKAIKSDLTPEQIADKINRQWSISNACDSLELLTRQMQQETERLKVLIKRM